MNDLSLSGVDLSALPDQEEGAGGLSLDSRPANAPAASRPLPSSLVRTEQAYDWTLSGMSDDDAARRSLLDTLPDRGEPGWGEMISDAWKRGESQKELGLLRYRQAAETGFTPESESEVARIKSGMTARPEISGWWKSAARSAAEMGPVMWHGMKAYARGGLKGAMGFGAIAAAAGQAGPQAAFPEEIVTVPAAAALGFGIVGSYESSDEIYKIETGLLLDEMLDWKDENGKQLNIGIATGMAAGGGMVISLLESAQITTLLKTIPGSEAVFKQASRAALTKMLQNPRTVLAALGRRAGEYGLTVAEETGQEVLQEMADVAFGEGAKAVNNYLYGTELDPASIEDITARLKDTAVESVKAFTVMSLPGHAARAGIEVGKVQSGAGEVSVSAPSDLGPDVSTEKTSAEGVGGAAAEDVATSAPGTAHSPETAFEMGNIPWQSPEAAAEVAAVDAAQPGHPVNSSPEAVAEGRRIADEAASVLRNHPNITEDQASAVGAMWWQLATVWAENNGRKPEEWYSEHLAGVRISRPEDVAGGEVLAQAAMKRSTAANIEEFAQFALDNPDAGRKEQYFSQGPAPESLVDGIGKALGVRPEGAEVRVASHTIRHGQTRHKLTAADWAILPDTMQRADDVFRLGPGPKAYRGEAVAIVQHEGDRARVIIAEVARTKNGPVVYVASFFEDSAARVGKWKDEHVAKIEKGLGTGGVSGLSPSPSQGRDDSQDTFSRREISPAASGVKALLQGLHERIPGASRAEFLATPEELPEHLRKADDDVGRLAARFDPSSGTAYYFPEAIADAAEAARVWLHEQVAHNGLRRLLGDDRLTLFLEDAARTLGIDTEAEGWTLQAEEAVARMAEKLALDEALTAPEEAVWRRVVSVVRDFLREAGLVDLTEEDIERTLKDAARLLMAGQKEGEARPNAPSVLFQSAFHGSPHRFDRFTTQMMGTGEGMQAFGWGMYFTSKKEIAEYYRKYLSRANSIQPTELGLNEFKKRTEEWKDSIIKRGEYLNDDYAKEIENDVWLEMQDEWDREPETYNSINDYNNAKERGYFQLDRHRGQLYEVEIPNEEKLFDWDKPLSEQSAYVTDKLENSTPIEKNGRQYILKKYINSFDEYTGEPNFNGRRLYRTVLAPLFGSERAASEYLNSIGIPGLRYLDGISRESGIGSHNYVIFADDHAQITNTFYQTDKAAVQFVDESRALLHLFESADVSSAIHETGHMLRRQLSPDDLAVVEGHFGVEKGVWGVDEEEAFASSFEAYVMQGRAPTPRLALVFAKLKQWMLDIYGAISGTSVRVAPEIRRVFDRMLTTRAERVRLRIANPFMVEEAEHTLESLGAPRPVSDIKTYDDLRAEAERRADERIARRDRVEMRRLEAAWKREAEDVASGHSVQRIIDHIVKAGGIPSDWLMQQYSADVVRELNRKRIGLVRKEGKVFPDEFVMDMRAAGEIDQAIETDDELISAILDAPTKGEIKGAVLDSLRAGYEMDRAQGGAMLDSYFSLLEAEADIMDEQLGRRMERMRDEADRDAYRYNFGRTPVSEVLKSGQQLARDHEKAQAEVRRLFEAGDRAGARDALETQRMVAIQLREVVRVRREVQAKLKSVSVLARRNMEPEFKGQFDAFLARFGLGQGTDERPQNLAKFLREEGEVEAAETVSERFANPLYTIPWGALRTEDFREMFETARQIAFLGARAGKLLAASRDATVQRAQGEMAQSILGALKTKPVPGDHKPAPPSARRKGPFARFMQGASEFHATLLKPEFIFRALDGDKEGAVHRWLFQPLKKAEDAELRLGESVQKKLDEVFAPFASKMREMRTKRNKVDGVDRMWTREEMIMVALNSGNEGNLAALREGYLLEDKEIAAINAALTAEEKKVVEDVWNILDSLFPDLDRVHRELTGKKLAKVSGRYFPLAFDRELSLLADKHASFREERLNSFNAYRSPGTEHGHRIERKGGREAPLLDFGVIGRHVVQTVHDITHSIPVRDVNKLASAESFRNLVSQTHGEEVWRQIRPWLQNIAAPQREPASKIEKWVGRVRRNAAYVAMGMRLTTATQNVVGFTQTIQDIGFMPTMRGIGAYMTDPWQAGEFVRDLSPSMKARQKTFDRDVMAAYGRFDPADMKWKRQVKDFYFAFFALIDNVVAYSSWLGAYKLAMDEKGMDEASAVEYADGVVRRTQPTGSALNLAEAQRGSELRKSLTMFYTFFNGTYNMLAESHRKYLRDPRAVLDLARAYWWILVVPALVGQVITDGEPPDKDKALRWAGRSIAGYTLATIPYVRDVAGPVVSGFRYNVSPVADAPATLVRLGQKIAKDGVNLNDEEWRAGTAKMLTMLAGYWWGLPSRAAIVFADGALDFAHGKTHDPRRLIYAERRKKK